MDTGHCSLLCKAILLSALPWPIASGEASAQEDLGSDYAKECIRKCMKSRNKHFQTGYVRLERVTWKRKLISDPLERYEYEYDIWFDTDKFRFDKAERLPNGKKQLQKYLIEGNTYTWLTPKGLSAEKGLLSEYDDIYAHFGLFHPRWLGQGVLPETILHREPKQRLPSQLYLSRPEAGLPVEFVLQATRVPLETHEAVKVVYNVSAAPADKKEKGPAPAASEKATRNETLSPRNEIAMWIVPEQGYSLAKAEFRKIIDGHVYVWSVENELERMPNTGVWYPRQVERLHTADGQIKRHSIITVRKAVFGEVGKDVFALATMEPIEGKQIRDRTQGELEKVYVWNGEEAVLIPGPNDAEVVPPKNLSGRFWLIVALTLAVVTCLGIWRLRAGASKARKP